MMERRQALRTLALSLGGLVSLPAWAEGWNAAGIRSTAPFLATGQLATLADVVDTIIPATSAPGAKALGVHEFVQTMVADCYAPETRKTLTDGLALLDEAARKAGAASFSATNPDSRQALLQGLDSPQNAAGKAFFGLVKGLTIQGFMHSEYVMTKLTNYEFMPGHYHGCVPVVAKATSSTPKK